MSPSGRGQTVQVAPFYRLLLGRGFESLPAPIRQLHDVSHETIARGRCTIRRGAHPLSRLVGTLFRLPPPGDNLPVKVRFLPQAGGERWFRRFGTHRIASYQMPAGRPGWMFESFGPGRFLIELAAGSEGLTLSLRGVRFLGLPLPRALWPQISAGESVERGRFVFDVEIALPVAGLLIHYRGHLRREDVPD
ncbi:MAG: DUF4166 domain-containing protein [Kiloniellales bacterium]|nr:DUF4166 domain-containing protein [Kiloniellales bacterium]